MFSVLETRNQRTSGTEIGRTPDFPESPNGSLSSETPSKDESQMDLNEFHLSPEVKSAIQSLSTKMKCSPEESLEMSLREHFCLPRPQRWMRESWITGGVVMEGER